MPKHLITIPNGAALPTDVTGLPEGYPFRDDTDGQLYTLKAGVFTPVAAASGGGGGGLGLVPVYATGSVGASAAVQTLALSLAGAQQTTGLMKWAVPPGLDSASARLHAISLTSGLPFAHPPSFQLDKYAAGDTSGFAAATDLYGLAAQPLTVAGLGGGSTGRLTVAVPAGGVPALAAGDALMLQIVAPANAIASGTAYVHVAFWFGSL